MPSRLFALCLAGIVLIGPLALHLFLPAIPAVKADFGLSDATAQLTFSIGIFAMALSTLVYGAMSDRYGRRPVLLTGLSLFLIGCAILATASSFSALIVGRIVQAVGAGCAMTLVRSIARDAYGQEHLAKAIAYLTMFYTMGPMISPIAGGILIDAYGWRAAFAFALALGSVVTFGVWAVLYETNKVGHSRFDLLAVLRGYVTPFRNPRFAAFVLQSGFSSGVFFTIAAAFSVIMKEQLGRPAAEYGLYFLVFPIGFLCGNFISSRLTGRVRLEVMVLAGAAILFVTTLAQASLFLMGIVTPLSMFGPGVLLTFAQGIALPSAQSGAIAMVPSSVGTAAGIGVFTQHFVGAVMAQIYGFVAGPTIGPLVAVAVLSASLSMLCGLLPFWLAKTAATGERTK